MPLVNCWVPLGTSPGEPQSTTAGISNDMYALIINYLSNAVAAFPAVNELTLADCCVVVISVSMTHWFPHCTSLTSQFLRSPEVVSKVAGVVGCGQVCGDRVAQLSVEESRRSAAVTD